MKNRESGNETTVSLFHFITPTITSPLITCTCPTNGHLTYMFFNSVSGIFRNIIFIFPDIVDTLLSNSADVNFALFSICFGHLR